MFIEEKLSELEQAIKNIEKVLIHMSQGGTVKLNEDGRLVPSDYTPQFKTVAEQMCYNAFNGIPQKNISEVEAVPEIFSKEVYKFPNYKEDGTPDFITKTAQEILNENWETFRKKQKTEYTINDINICIDTYVITNWGFKVSP